MLPTHEATTALSIHGATGHEPRFTLTVSPGGGVALCASGTTVGGRAGTLSTFHTPRPGFAILRWPRVCSPNHDRSPIFTDVAVMLDVR